MRITKDTEQTPAFLTQDFKLHLSGRELWYLSYKHEIILGNKRFCETIGYFLGLPDRRLVDLAEEKDSS